MKKSELRQIIREEIQNLSGKKEKLQEGFWGRVLNGIWTITGVKDGLFKAIQSQYGADANKAYKEITDANEALERLKKRLEKL
jgi:hypothetical protein